MIYNKLVRDNIPEIIKNKGRNPKIHTANDAEYWFKLKDKLKEEVEEFLKDSNEEEIADIQEVIDAICKYKNFSKENIESIKKKKALERGIFNNKTILDEA